MGKVLLVVRLAARDLQRHPAQAVLLFLVLTTAATTLTLGLLLHGETASPYATTRAGTRGPDVVAALGPTFGRNGSAAVSASPAVLAPVEHARGVVSHDGPYPATFAALTAHGIRTSAMLEGRDPAPAALDQPALTAGGWLRPGGVVVERSFADELGLRVGDALTLNGHGYHVAGIAVDAAFPPSNVCNAIGCPGFSGTPSEWISGVKIDPDGLIWLPRADVARLAAPNVGLSYVVNLKLSGPAQAEAFVRSPVNNQSFNPALWLTAWQDTAASTASFVTGAQQVLLVFSSLLILLALVSVAVLAGGRMAEQTRRVGLLKAVGATPGTVVVVLLAEHVAVALAAAAAGLLIGRLVAPLLTNPGGGLLGVAGTPPVTALTVVTVAGVAVAVAVLATLFPARRASYTSTVSALADAARPPRRGARLSAVSARLPLPILIGARLAARRPRRVVWATLSIAVTVMGIAAVLIARANIAPRPGTGSVLDTLQHQRQAQILLVVTVMLVVLAALNALLITWATVLDNRHSSALARALGATPQQVSTGIVAAQLLSVLPGSLLGIPLGVGLYAEARRHDSHWLLPSPWWFAAVVAGTWLAMAALTAIPARIGARRPVAGVLQAEGA
jgi:putative ABC transport system permease protein